MTEYILVLERVVVAVVAAAVMFEMVQGKASVGDEVGVIAEASGGARHWCATVTG